MVRISHNTIYHGPIRSYIKEYATKNSLNNKKLYEFVQYMREVTGIEYNPDLLSDVNRQIIASFANQFSRTVYSANKMTLKTLHSFNLDNMIFYFIWSR